MANVDFAAESLARIGQNASDGGGLLWGTILFGGTIGGTTDFAAGYNGSLISIPKGWQGRIADNGKGVVYQKPGSQGNANMIRIMDPTENYPNGYARYYNKHGQPLNVNGKPGDRASTHIPLDYAGPIPGWPK